MTKNANYRKLNDRSLSSSTYHKKDGTAVRGILKATPAYSGQNSHSIDLIVAVIYPRHWDWLIAALKTGSVP